MARPCRVCKNILGGIGLCHVTADARTIRVYKSPGEHGRCVVATYTSTAKVCIKGGVNSAVQTPQRSAGASKLVHGGSTDLTGMKRMTGHGMLFRAKCGQIPHKVCAHVRSKALYSPYSYISPKIKYSYISPQIRGVFPLILCSPPALSRWPLFRRVVLVLWCRCFYLPAA